MNVVSSSRRDEKSVISGGLGGFQGFSFVFSGFQKVFKKF